MLPPIFAVTIAYIGEEFPSEATDDDRHLRRGQRRRRLS